MSNDNVERAIKRGTGEGEEATHYDEIVYEGYAPGGPIQSHLANQAHFFAVAARAVRQILVNYARSNSCLLYTSPSPRD